MYSYLAKSKAKASHDNRGPHHRAPGCAETQPRKRGGAWAVHPRGACSHACSRAGQAARVPRALAGPAARDPARAVDAGEPHWFSSTGQVRKERIFRVRLSSSLASVQTSRCLSITAVRFFSLNDYRRRFAHQLPYRILNAHLGILSTECLKIVLYCTGLLNHVWHEGT